jgi:hypothetical protein
MKNIATIVTVIITLLFAGCKPDKKMQNQEITFTAPEKALISELDTFYLGNELVHVEKINKSDFEAVASNTIIDTSEVKSLMLDSITVKRHGDTLVIKTNAKEVKLVNNNNDEDDTDLYITYKYYGYIKDADKYLIHCWYYEGHDYKMIDRKTGSITDTWGVPLVSPNGKLFMTGNTDLVASYTYNGIQLFENTHKPKLIAQRELQTWGPDEIRWLDNKTLLVKASMAETATESEQHPEYYKLRLE